MQEFKKKGDEIRLITKWSYIDNPNIQFCFKIEGMSEYSALQILRAFYYQVKEFAFSNPNR